MSKEKIGTYSGQSSLPRLPIPELDDTLKRFERIVLPLMQQKHDNAEGRPQQSEEEQCYSHTVRDEVQKIIHDFKNGNGPKLQELLRKYDEDGKKDGSICSYVEEFWSDSYLSPECSVVLNLNPYFLLEDGPNPHNSKSQIGRASELCFASCKFASLLKKGELSPDTFRGQNLCMDQFKALFGASRIPLSDEKDIVEVDPDSTHVVVIKKNQMYYFQALWPDGTVAVNQDDISDILEAISRDVDILTDNSSTSSSKRAVGVLTTLSRKAWANARTEINNLSERNKETLEIIDRALFVLVLDDFIPKDVNESAANMLHGTNKLVGKKTKKQQEVNNSSTVVELVEQEGTCCNRWYDKLQIIVCSDGQAGVNFEHSAIDGHTALRCVSDIFADSIISFARSITKTIYGSKDNPTKTVLNANIVRAASILVDNNDQGDAKTFHENTRINTRPKRLGFDLSPGILERIFFAETALGDQINASDTHVLCFKEYGKSMIVSNKMSPDSFVQMSILLSYYRLYGQIVSSYEPVLTKRFLHGRTEAMRSTTPKAVQFCKVFCNGEKSKREKLNSLHDAIQEHSTFVKKESATGFGVDRHLFAMKCIAERNSIDDEFFKSDPWKLMNHTVISTSNCGNPSLRLFGFGPVVPDGFGVGYIIRDSGLQYSVSSKHRQTKRFVNCLENTLYELGNMLKESAEHNRKSFVEVDNNEHFVQDTKKLTRKLRKSASDVNKETGFGFLKLVRRTRHKDIESFVHQQSMKDV